MIQEYDDIISHYYSLYRPKLHDLILTKCLHGDEKFTIGLDIGCGVGHSSLALSNYCEKVRGIDPSSAMLSRAKRHPRVAYGLFNKNKIEFQNNYFDLVSLAGSLYYSKSQAFFDEIMRVCASNSVILVYDFEVDLRYFKRNLGVKPLEEVYDHRIDLTGLNTDRTVELAEKKEEHIEIHMSKTELTYLLLSDKSVFEELKSIIGTNNMEEEIIQNLEFHNSENKLAVDSTIYYTKYVVH